MALFWLPGPEGGFIGRRASKGGGGGGNWWGGVTTFLLFPFLMANFELTHSLMTKEQGARI